MVLSVDTVIVGGGALGSAAAWQLARRGAEVLVLEQSPAAGPQPAAGSESPGGPAEPAAAAFSAHPFLVASADSVRLAMLREAVPEWAELEASSERPLVWRTGAALHGAVPDLDVLTELVQRFGFEAEALPAAEAERRWPGLVFEERVLSTPGAGSVDPVAAVASLRRAAAEEGAEFRHGHRVTRVRVLGDDEVRLEVQPVDAEGEPAGSGEVVVARQAVFAVGVWTSKLLGRVIALPHTIVGRSQPTRYSRKHPLEEPWPVLSHRPEPGSRRHRSWPGALDAVPDPSGVVLRWRDVGKVVDPDAGPARPDPRQRTALQRYLREWLPGADPEGAVETWSVFARTADTQFVIDRIGPVVVGAGLPERGFAFVPAVGRILADLAEGSGGNGPGGPRSAAGPARFSLLPSRRERS
ncbi:FAD-binding oxidoreductase [Herbiconiux sp. CPCC 203407]|uniref:FAD-binding oxidoreductase n=1 Tax=Herbiconiux oxytropis TaxID=2970915 RepID=A0AA41XIH7_9MICO|nr:FAD-dependent oxidoreductase [Herbiconiux oxytropis]MCS5722174.1 FAD-binding oxidoreductase [Herbiconiux oxytropis]MCS5725756.1 FAD-binding oxidoreductase [Herbiconiux oxytropis]